MGGWHVAAGLAAAAAGLAVAGAAAAGFATAGAAAAGSLAVAVAAAAAGLVVGDVGWLGDLVVDDGSEDSLLRDAALAVLLLAGPC